MEAAVNVSLAANPVFAYVPLYRNFTLEFVADLDDPQGQWQEVLSLGDGLAVPTAWVYPEGNRLWACIHFRFGICNFTRALARRTCVNSRAFPNGVMKRRVRISLSPAGSFELHEDYREDGRLELSAVAQVPHRPSSGGASLPLGLTREYPKASGQLLDLRLTPYIPYPPPPPDLAAPVPVTQTLLGDEWLDLQQSHSAALGEVKVGVDWTVSFEISLRSTVPQRALLFAIGRGGAFWLPKVWLRPGSFKLEVCLSSIGNVVPSEIRETSDIMTDPKFLCVGGRRAANSS